jgi:hypothetical protein
MCPNLPKQIKKTMHRSSLPTKAGIGEKGDGGRRKRR